MNRLHQSAQNLSGSGSSNLNLTRLREVICEHAETHCFQSFGNTLAAIVLTGSLARDEASFDREGNIWTSAGDAEFLLVFNPNTPDPATATIDATRRSIHEALAKRGIFCSINLSPVDPNYFKRLPAHIFSYELRHCGVVIGGTNRILDTIPDFSVNDLSLADAWRLLCNRLVEQLMCVNDFSSAEMGLSRRLEYSTIKLYLDMATSYLVFVGGYEPTYRGRARRLRELTRASESNNSAPFAMGDFTDRVAECTEWKLAGGHGPSALTPAYWKEAISCAYQLWRWEINRMTGAPLDLTTSALWDRMAAKLEFSEKIRGWASTARRCGGIKSVPHWWRWIPLALHATPRYMIYRVGTELAFVLPSLVEDSSPPTSGQDWAKLGKLLPICERMTHASENNWQFLARQVLSNYQTFVTSTRA